MREITIYTTRFCPYCIQLKRVLKAHGLEFVDISVDRDRELRQKISEENGGWNTVPMVIIDGKFIGGYTEVIALQESGKLV